MKYIVIEFLLCMIGCHNCVCFGQNLPIKPSRTVEFTTDECSYMNVDVSSDGKTLVFDLLGDLYTMPSKGGRAIQLTRGIALHLRPIWSPDGKKIAYISDTSGDFRLCVMNLDGPRRVLGISSEQVSYGFDPIWEPDNGSVVIGGMRYDLTGRKMSLGTKGNELIRFSRDRKFSYSEDSGKIYRINRLNGVREAISDTLKPYRKGMLSPDERWWCYVADSDKQECLLALNLMTHATKVLVPALLKGDTRYRGAVPLQHFSFSPDSKYVFIGYGGKVHRINMESFQDEEVPFQVRIRSDLGPYDYNTFRIQHDSIKVKYTRSANWSSDKRHIVFFALGRVYVLDALIGKIRPAVEQPFRQFQPVYSPDGKWIAYVSWCDTIGGFLWRVPANGGFPQKLTDIPGEYQHPVWSPDGKYLAVLRGKPKLGDRDDKGVAKLLLVSVDSGSERVIQDSLPLWNRLAFSPDGQRIFYTPRYVLWSQKGSNIPQLVSTDLHGGNLKVIAVGGEFSVFDEKLLSPDGRFLVFSAGEDLYLIPNKDTGRPIVMSYENREIPGIRVGAGVDPFWEKGGRVLAWSYGKYCYRISPDSVISKTDRGSEAPDSTRIKDFVYSAIKPKESATINLSAPYFYARGTIALTNARIVTMEGDRVIEHGAILVKEGRIQAVGSAGSIPIPPGVKELDLKGATIIPGLVDVHLHMRVPSNIFPEQSWMFLINLAYGVTTARDPSLSFDSFGYAEMLESGQMIGPRLYSVGRAVRLGDEVVRVDNLEDAQAIVDKRSEMGGTTIKQYLLPSRLQKEWLLVASERDHLNMTNEGADAPIFQLGMIKDGSTGVEHNPIWGDIYKDVTNFVALSHIYFTPTLQVCFGTEEAKEYFKYKYWRQPSEKLMRFTYSNPSGGLTANGAESIETIMHSTCLDTIHPGFLAPASIDTRILRAGGRICVGSHGNDEGIGVHNEIWALQMGGFTNLEALRSATITGAEALGLQRDIGSIKAGKIADLLILEGNPLEDIHNTRMIRFVMKDGVLYDGDTLDTIWPFKKKCPAWKLK